MINELLVAFNIESSKISAAVAKVDSFRNMQIIAVTSVKNYGIKKSVVINAEETIESIKQCKSKLESLIDSPINEAYIGIKGGLCEIFESEAGVDITAGGVISEKDIEKVKIASKQISLPADKEIIWLSPLKYTTDTLGSINNPIGSRGKRLNMYSQLYTADSAHISKIRECMQHAGINVKGVIPEPLAMKEVIFSSSKIEGCSGLIDIGAETIDLSIYENGGVCYTKSVPLGGNNITKDIAACLNVTFAEAEKVKLTYKEILNFNENDEEQKESTYSRYNLGMIKEVIEARAEELLTFALEELNNQKYIKEFENIYLTGGGILSYNDIIEKFNKMLPKPMVIVENNDLSAGNYIHFVPAGILKIASDNIKIIKSNNERNDSNRKSDANKRGIVSKLKHFIEEFL